MPFRKNANPNTVGSDPGAPSRALGAGASRRWDLVYASLALLGLPLLLWRRWVLKKDQGWKQKCGHVPVRERHPKRIWIHAVSVGEAQAAWTLYQEIRRAIPEADVVISTTTATGQDVARKRFGEKRVFYYPLDFSGALRRCFERVKPSLIVLMELEVWPNFTREALGRDVPVVIVNGRITERSGKRYRQAWRLLGPSFRRVRRWLMQTEEYAERVRALGVEEQRIEIGGNVKYDAVGAEGVSGEERARARADLGIPAEARVVMGGSTHPTEEGVLLDCYRSLLDGGAMEDLRLVLVPRHPQRLNDVEKEIRARGFACVRRSALKESGLEALAPISEAQRGAVVVLVDTVGELKHLFCAADLAFVGGSLIPHGGQNVMEPAGMGLPVIYGPHMHNFSEAVAMLVENQGSVQVDGAEQLGGEIKRLLDHPEEAAQMGHRAREALLARQGASAKCVSYLKRLLEPSSPP